MAKKKIPKESGEISRREFLKDAGLVVGGAAIGSTVLLAACGEGEVTTETVTTTTTVTETVSKYVCPYDGMEFDTLAALTAHVEAEHPEEELTKLNVNGQQYELIVEPNWTLLFVLRNKLGLTGTKISCDEGSCGVCTVLIDDKPVYSCMVLAIECVGKKIETIEGLYDGVTLHPIQQAFIDNFGIECGYCTPGIIMATKALLDKNSDPTEQEVKQALAGTICKCGQYQYITASVLAAAGKMRGE